MKRRRDWLITSFFVAHVIEAVLLFVLLWNYDFVAGSSTVPGSVFAIFGQQIPADHIAKAVENPDALQIAYNVGVLELVSLALTILAIIIGLGAFFGFWMIRGAAMRAAEDAAHEEMEELVPKLARQWFENEGRKIFEEAAALRTGASDPSIDITGAAEATVIRNANEIGGI